MATLTVEDGTGKTDADAFVSVADCETFLTRRGLVSEWSAKTDAQKEEAIVRATIYLSESFGWMGYRRRGRGSSAGMQSLAWPRTDVWDREGYSVPQDSVPQEIVDATCILARQEIITPGSMTPTFTPSAVQKSVKVGPITTTFENTRTDSRSTTPQLPIVQELISQFLAGDTGSMLSGDTAVV